MSDELMHVWAVTFSFYTPGICGGTVTVNVLEFDGLKAVALARAQREKHHATQFQKFALEKLEKICDVNLRRAAPPPASLRAEEDTKHG